MVYRVYVKKRSELDVESKKLFNDIVDFLRIDGLKELSIYNRYDVEDIDEKLFDYCIKTVFSEPQTDEVYYKPDFGDSEVFAVEYLIGQYDQRADSACQCVQLISKGERPTVRTARIYALNGQLSLGDIERIKKFVINPVEAHEVPLVEYETIKFKSEIPSVVKNAEGFTDMDKSALTSFISEFGLAMDIDDITFCRDYFKKEGRQPTITEIRMIDTYWSDHCRHTTFLTTIDGAEIECDEVKEAYGEYLRIRGEINRKKPITLMDMATIGAKYLKKEGLLEKLDESEEINACTVKIKVDVNEQDEDWLLLFKNETHNHPTEIEPFGGAATCIGGAIRDPLSGRSYVYAAMRVTGAGNPLLNVEQTIKGKLPQRKLVTTAAAGYSSYGNQIGLATGQVTEIYHDGYVAKRMEIGAVIGAVPQKNVVRETPLCGDKIILLGGRTGRDGCGGATGSSKSHSEKSLSACGAEVQKGNAPEERKLQRLFRNADASRLIKRCNDFGAGGVSVAIGELADGIDINLNAVPKKYDGLDGTELAISESQERMAVVVSSGDVDKFKEYADAENLEATVVAEVTDTNRLRMVWNGNTIVDISRDFLNSNGAEKHIAIKSGRAQSYAKSINKDFEKAYGELVGDLNVCGQRGLTERFDSTIGSNTVLMPLGGRRQLTPSAAMVHKVAVEKGFTSTCSLMSFGYNPFITEKNQFEGAYLAVVESVSKLIACGAEYKDIYLTFQEYFEKPLRDGEKWGKPFNALLGALKAQLDLGIAAIGGKDSMSGTFEKLTVPPTLVSFAVTTSKVDRIISQEFKIPYSKVVMILPACKCGGLPEKNSLINNFKLVARLIGEKKVLACAPICYGGIAEAVFKMCLGNGLGFEFEKDIPIDAIFRYNYGGFVVELVSDEPCGITLGRTIPKNIKYGETVLSVDELYKTYSEKLESVYPTMENSKSSIYGNITYNSEDNEKYKNVNIAKRSEPKVLIPVFPGTNCEYDTAKAFSTAGAKPEIFVINNLTGDNVLRSVDGFVKNIKDSQIIFIPGGFSGGDEPDGSGKFITAFFRNPEIKSVTEDLLNLKDGLIGGICNGFQALIKLGLLPFGKILDAQSDFPTLSYNTIGRHQSRLVRTRVCSTMSPWMKNAKVGDIFTQAISHGEGRFIADDKIIKQMIENGQIATQYVDFDGNATDDIRFNPNGSVLAIEGITSKDGRVFGKMGHSERKGLGLYKNVDGNYDMKIFESAVEYFK